jgi:hypothetical protein
LRETKDWLAQGDDFRTFLGEFLAGLQNHHAQRPTAISAFFSQGDDRNLLGELEKTWSPKAMRALGISSHSAPSTQTKTM